MILRPVDTLVYAPVYTFVPRHRSVAPLAASSPRRLRPSYILFARKIGTEEQPRNAAATPAGDTGRARALGGDLRTRQVERGKAKHGLVRGFPRGHLAPSPQYSRREERCLGAPAPPQIQNVLLVNLSDVHTRKLWGAGPNSNRPAKFLPLHEKFVPGARASVARRKVLRAASIAFLVLTDLPVRTILPERKFGWRMFAASPAADAGAAPALDPPGTSRNRGLSWPHTGTSDPTVVRSE